MTEKQQILLQSAQQSFCDLGYAGASTAKIGRLAGTSEALIFRHFGSKRDLARLVVKEGQKCRASMSYGTLNHPDPSEVLRGFIGLHAMFLAGKDPFVPWIAGIRIVNENPDFFEEDGFIVERLTWAVSSVGHAKAGAVTRIIISTLDQALLYAFKGQEDQAEALIVGLREIILNE